MEQLSKDDSKRLFVLVNKNNLNENVNFTFPTKYYEEAHRRMVAIDTYLYRHHSASVLKFSFPMEQSRMRYTT